ncbi:DUF5659 domain-containing protein [Candidatus Nomurabacteria bacterium]|nr:DUF5659 domain-containing protein [Candidatus Nomurabacteria bacterium]
MNSDFKYLNVEEKVSLSDMCLVSCLVSLNFPIIAFDRDPKEYPKVKMVFNKTKELEKTITNFWAGLLQVEPKNYWNAIREIKSRLKN